MQKKMPLVKRIMEKIMPKQHEPDIVKSEKPALPFKEQERLNKELLGAAKTGNNDEIRRLLKAGADIFARDKYAGTALHWAANNEHAETCKLIIEKYEEKDRDMNTMMFVGTHDRDGYTALHYAADNGNVQICALLLEKGADINAKEGMHDWTALHTAALEGKTDVCALLLEKGADINAKDNVGRTALILAGVAAKNKTTVAFLTFAPFAPGILVDWKEINSFYSSFEGCLSAA
jgi:ankyrin repeat protein